MLAFAGLCSSFMFTLVVPLQAELPNLLNASREEVQAVRDKSDPIDHVKKLLEAMKR